MARAADYVDPSGKWVKEYAIAPRYTPLWMRTTPAETGAETSAAPGSAIVEIYLAPDEDDSSDLIERRRDTLLNEHDMKRAYKGKASDWIHGVTVLHEGSPVGWYDLDNGFVRYATLWDLAHLKQGVPQDSTDPETAQFADRPLWLLSQKQWDEAEFPPPIKHGPPFAKGVTVAGEAGRMREMREARPRRRAAENPVDVSDALPWVKVSRDPERYQAALKDAKAIGPIDDPKKVYELLGPALLKEDQETFVVILLDVRQQCRGVAEVHRGSRSRVSTSLVDILRVVIASGAEGFIVVHNHPSGTASPSEADKDLTKSIEDAAKLFDGDTAFVDHVICGDRQYYSFADKKLHKVKK